MASSGYGQGREQLQIRQGAVITEQVCNEGMSGYLFNQPIVRDEHQEEVRLDTLLGPGFVLVGFGGFVLDAASRDIIDKLNIRLVDLSNIEIVKGRFAHCDHSDQVLVRPDRLVFGHTTPDYDANQLFTSLSEAVALND